MSRTSLLLLSLALSGCALHALATKKRSYPVVDGTLEAPGLSAPATVYRDAYGVPHVRAETETDLWYAIGFVHAQDRLFQMDLMRRLGSGRVAELAGPEALEYDAFVRSLGLVERVEAQMATIDPRIVDVGTAYAAGVNAGAASLPALPVEYRVLGLDFEQWVLTDATASILVNSWALAENPVTELVAYALRDKLDRDDLEAALRWDPESPEIDPWWDEVRTAQFGDFTPEFEGFMEFFWGVQVPSRSNNWVIGPERSADGAPILASDPHMPQMVPSMWYLLEGRGGDTHIAGATVSGVPLVSIGHNGQVSWGVTNVMTDYVDFAVLERAGERGYVLNGETKELDVSAVEVEARGGKTVTREVYWTEVGPVITQLEGTHLMALRWHVFEVEDHTPDVLLALQHAKTVDDLLALGPYPSVLSQSFVAADTEGHIAWQTVGSMPRRTGYTGRVPYPASEPGLGWDGWVALRPGLKDPPQGYVHTANNRPDHPDAHTIGTGFMPPWRQDRIAALVEATAKHTPETVSDTQLDLLDTHAEAMLPVLLEGIDPDHSACARTLTDWDFETDADSRGTAVWAVFYDRLVREALRDSLDEEELDLYAMSMMPGRAVVDAGLEHYVEDRSATMERALDETCAWLTDRLGPDPTQWTWGALHPLHVRHPFSEATKLLSGWDMPEVPYHGTTQTVNVGGYVWHGEEPLETKWLASMRLIVPMSDPGQ
ncbi:MAG: penicillin acylase family protein, partial [Deltaproteobacteria bacterium]|nr:penicillin acylase family protein [Deltaproteobacteria bacterium]